MVFSFLVSRPTLSGSAETRPFRSDDSPYLRALGPTVTVTPLLTVGESVPLTSNHSQTFRLIGIPDGMGIWREADGSVRLWVNHELGKNAVSQPIAGAPLHSGAFVSAFLLSGDSSSILSGDFAATTFFDGAKPWDGTPAKFCSGFLAGPEVGFDRPIYLTGEEAEGKESGDDQGGLGFAFVGGSAYALTELGRYKKENLVVVPGTGLKTVLFGLEDGPKGLQSELYLYIGRKDLSSSDALERNGLTGGTLYVFGAATGGKNDEATFRKTDRPVVGHWLPVPAAKKMTDSELASRVANMGAFRFDRIEDGTYDRNQTGVFYFVTTGGDIPENRKGRLYRLTFNPADPLKGPILLEILLEGDAGDGIVNPDNIDLNTAGEMILQEDFTAANLPELLKRNASIWLYRPDSGERPIRIAEVNGKSWESSGVIDASGVFGPGTWLINIQAHSIDSREASEKQNLSGDAQLVEGGQILLLRTREADTRR